MATKKGRKPKVGIDYADLLKQAGVEGEVDLDALRPAFRATNNVNAILKTAALDPAALAAILAALAGGGATPAPTAPKAGVDIAALIQLFLPMLIALVQSQLNKPAPVPVPPVAPPADTDPEPLPDPDPSEPDDPFEGREITSFRLSPFWYQRSASSSVVSKEERDEVLSQGEPMIPRSRFAVDCDILDQFGREIQAGPAQEAWINENLWFGEKDAEPNTHRMRWFFEGGDGVADITESGNGFVPKIKIGKDALVEDNKDYQTGRLYGVFTRKDGKVIKTPFFPSLRAKR